MAKRKAAASSARPKVTFEFNVLDEPTKKALAQCIDKTGKIKVSMVLKGKVKDDIAGGFEQKVD
jgi:hypothetical protein